MAKPFTLSPEKEELISELSDYYVAHQALFRRFLQALHSQISDAIDPENGDPLSKFVHSVKFRLKDPAHLKEKLRRKMKKCEKNQTEFPYMKENLFEKINDLAGYRILHLHTRQFAELHQYLVPVLVEAHRIIEGPEAKTWDNETKAYYESIGVKTTDNERLYSSVHYVVQPNSKTPITMEIQVRTLADEIWGEIDHKINYPEPHMSLPCRELILALARTTSSCSRLADAIMTTHKEWEDNSLSAKEKTTSSPPSDAV